MTISLDINVRMAGGLSSGGGGIATGAPTFGTGNAQQAGQTAAKAYQQGFGTGIKGISRSIDTELGRFAGAAASAVGEKIGKGIKLGLIAGIGGATAAVGLALNRAIDVDQLRPQLEKFAALTGDSLPSAMKKLQAETRGTVSQFDLMQASTNALTIGIVKTVPEMGELVNLAKELGDAAGVKTNAAIEILTNSVASLNERGLRTGLKLQVDFKGAILDNAIATGRMVEQIDEAEKGQIALNHALERAREATKGNLQTTTQLADNWERFKAKLDDTRTALGEQLAPTFSKLLDVAQPLFDGMANFLSQQGTGGLEQSLEGIRDTLKEAGDFLGALKFDEAITLAQGQFEKLWDFFVQEGEVAIEKIKVALKEDLNKPLFTFTGEGLAGKFGAKAGSVAVPSPFSFDTTSGVDRIRSEGAARRAGIDARLAPIIDANAARRQTVPAVQPIQDPNAAPSASLKDAAGALKDSAAALTGAATGKQPAQRSSTPGAPARPAPTLTGNVSTSAGRFGALQNTLTSSFPDIRPELIEKLGPTLIGLAADTNEAKESFLKVRDALSRAADNDDIDRFVRAQKEAADAAENQASELDRHLSDLREKQDSFREKLAGLHDEELQSRKDIASTFIEELKTIDAQAAEAQKSLARSKTDSLVGEVGGLDAEGGIPLRLRKAAKKVRREQTRQRKAELEADSAGLTSDELAANGGQKLREILGRQGAREAGRDVQGQADINAQAVKAIQEAEAKKSKAEAELTAEIKKTSDQTVKSMEANQKLQEQTKELLTKVIDRLKTLEKEAEQTRKAQEALSRK